MARKPVSGFAEAGAAMAQQLDDNDLLNLFSAIGRVVSKRFLMKRPSLKSAWGSAELMGLIFLLCVVPLFFLDPLLFHPLVSLAPHFFKVIGL